MGRRFCLTLSFAFVREVIVGGLRVLVSSVGDGWCLGGSLSADRLGLVTFAVVTPCHSRQQASFSLPCLGDYRWLRTMSRLRLRCKRSSLDDSDISPSSTTWNTKSGEYLLLILRGRESEFFVIGGNVPHRILKNFVTLSETIVRNHH